MSPLRQLQPTAAILTQGQLSVAKQPLEQAFSNTCILSVCSCCKQSFSGRMGQRRSATQCRRSSYLRIGTHVIRKDSYYLLILFAPALYVFYVLMTWIGCQPISDVGEYIDLLAPGESVPEGVSCFATNHMTSLTFYEYPPVSESLLQLSLLAAVLIACTLALFPVVFRIGRNLKQLASSSRSTGML